MADLLQRYAVQRFIQDSIAMIDALPLRHDLIPAADTVQVVIRAHIAHLTIERGLKALILYAQVPNIEIHALLKLFHKLKNSDKKAAEFLEIVFRDAVEFYGYNYNVDGFNHFRNLRDYLSRVGGKKAFDQYRYWALGEKLESEDDIPPISLSIHRELACALALLVGPRTCQTVSQRVDQAIGHAIRDSLPPLYNDTDKHRQDSFRNYLNAQQAPFRNVLKDAVRQKFVVGDDEFSGRLLRKAYDDLKQSKDPAIQYFVRKLEYLPRNYHRALPGFTPEMEWLNATQTSGMVLTPADSILGYVEKYADGRWGVESAESGSDRVTDVTETLSDAKRYLVDRMTRQIEVQIGSDTKVLRVVNIQNSHFPCLQDGEWSESSDESNKYVLEFWDRDHGLKPGDTIEAKLRLKEEPSGISVLEGDVCSVDGHKVSVSGNDFLDLDDG